MRFFAALLVVVLLLTSFSFTDAQKPQNFYEKYIKSQDIFSYLNVQPAKTALDFDTSIIFSSRQIPENNIYGLKSRKEYADYLFQSKQYKLSAIEYDNIMKAESSPQNLLKLTKSLVGAGELSRANACCDSLAVSFPLRAFNIKACLYIMTDDFDSFDSLPKSQLVTSINYLRYLPVHFKKPAVAGVMSMLIPGSGQIYSGDIPEGVATIIVTAFDAFHIVNGVKKYGVKDIYPIISIGLGTVFYIRNIVRAVKISKSKNRYLIKLRNDKIADYMFTTLF